MSSNNKNIIILGCQRSGKTTLTKLLTKNSNYNIFPIDSLVFAFEKGMPEIGINSSTYITEKSKQFAPFLDSYFKAFSINYPKQKYIIEGCQLLPEDVICQPHLAKSHIICLGYPNATIR